jgi:hypothetical protein
MIKYTFSNELERIILTHNKNRTVSRNSRKEGEYFKNGSGKMDLLLLSSSPE